MLSLQRSEPVVIYDTSLRNHREFLSHTNRFSNVEDKEFCQIQSVEGIFFVTLVLQGDRGLGFFGVPA